MNVVDLFCGCGGLSLGFQEEGFNIVLGIDNWNDSIETFNRNIRGSNGIATDINKLSSDMIRSLVGGKDIDVIVGGPPCQGFSTVGKKQLEDPRNSLYLEFFRLVRELKPKAILVENVSGLRTLHRGLVEGEILENFRKIGYEMNSSLLNSANFGVPQNRKRLFFVGNNLDIDFVFPNPKSFKIGCKDAIGDLPKLDRFRNNINFPSTFDYEKPARTGYQRLMRENSERIINHELTHHTDETVNVISLIKDGGRISDLPKKYWNIRKYNKSFQRMNSMEPSHTIDTGHRNYFHYDENRIPTVRECARLQSFPDRFIFLGTKSSQYKQVGNAVPPLLSREMAKLIKDHLSKDDVI